MDRALATRDACRAGGGRGAWTMLRRLGRGFKTRTAATAVTVTMYSVPGPCSRLGTWGYVFFLSGLFRGSRPRSRLGSGAGHHRTWPRQTRTRLAGAQEFCAATLGSPLLQMRRRRSPSPVQRAAPAATAASTSTASRVSSILIAAGKAFFVPSTRRAGPARYRPPGRR